MNGGDDVGDHNNGSYRRAYRYMDLGFERLERYALERGMTSLRADLPPNRAISRAFRELELEQWKPRMYQSLSTASEQQNGISRNVDTADLIIDLPRYSWTTLGRSLLRACREGITSTSDEHDGWTIQKSWKTSNFKDSDFASPCIQVKISLLLTLSRNLLARICEYAGKDVQGLESTCRSLSTDIISARAMLEKDRNMRMKQMEQEMGDMLKESEMAENSSDKGASISDAATNQNLMKFAHRSSKRVRSQLITSGKQAERSAKRNSIEYCLVSSIVPCTISHPDYTACLNERLDWDNLKPLHEYSDMIKYMSEASTKDGNEKDDVANSPGMRGNYNRNGMISRIRGSPTLTTFINVWSRKNSGARDLLHRFLAHVSCYVESVYKCEEGNIMMLTQCISECKYGI